LLFCALGTRRYVEEESVRDVWKSALEWYIYYADRERKEKFATVIMGVKNRLGDVSNKGDLVRHYMNTDGLCESVIAELFPNELWLDARQVEDVAYGLRCLELSTGKKIDLARHAPSRWLIETAG
jgi:hypothetical protein